MPAGHFEVVSRPESIITVPLNSLSLKDTDDTNPSSPLTNIGAASSSSISTSSTAQATQRESSTAMRSPHTGHSSTHTSSGSRLSTADKKVQPLYGVVLYDFQAERPDELQASAGESIIIIAQSNDEWFVAKPIGRLGGPGLIPVSFIQIRDMGSDRPVAENLLAAKLAAVPKVEEWKRMTAEYKASSIPLGRHGSEQAVSSIRDSNVSSTGSSRHSDHHNHQQQQGYSQMHQQQAAHHAHQHHGGNHVYVTNAAVERYAFDGGRYWYLVVCELSNGRFRNLCRYYQDFYDFQIRLLDEFPDEAGRTGRQQRTLPFMPGPLTYVNDSISSQRRANLDEYVHNLLYLPSYISRSSTVQQLFELREGDIETHSRSDDMPMVPSWDGEDDDEDIDNDDEEDDDEDVGDNEHVLDHRHEDGSASEHVQEYESGVHQNADEMLPYSGKDADLHSRSRSDHELESHHDQENTPVEFGYDLKEAPRAETQVEPMGEQDLKTNSFEAATMVKSMSTSTIPDTPTSGSVAHSATPRQFIKIKVFYKDDLIAIRVPSDVPLDELTRLISERLQTSKVLGLKFKNEVSGELLFINSSSEFKHLLSGREKIVLYAE